MNSDPREGDQAAEEPEGSKRCPQPIYDPIAGLECKSDDERHDR